MSDREPIYFASPDEFRAWLDEHHQTASELLVGFYKVGTGIPSMSWSQSVDEALCYGWIDGVRRGVDEQRYTIRFTPRKLGSNWSAVNVKKVAALTEAGRMRPAGIAAFEARTDDKTAIYTYEQSGEATLGEEYEQRLKANDSAWSYFQSRPSWYRRTAIRWVLSAKRQETRDRRLATLIDDSAAGRPIKSLDRSGGSR